MAKTSPPVIGTNISQAGLSNKSTTVSRKLHPAEPGRITQLRSDLISLGVFIGPNIKADSITATEISAGAVGSTELADGSITTTKLAAGSVTAAKITAGTITATEIHADAITTSKILDANISTAKVATDAITAIWTYSSSATANLGEYFNQSITRTANTELLMFVQLAPQGVSGTDFVNAFPYFYYKRNTTTISSGNQLLPMAYIDAGTWYRGPVVITSNNIDIANVSGSQTYKFGAYKNDETTELPGFGYVIILIERKR